MEGVGTVIAEFMREEFSRNLFTKLAGLAALPVLRALQKRIDSRGYNGGSLLGLRGIVVKSHGSADAYSYSRAIDVAILEVERAVTTLIDQHLADALVKEQSL